MSCPEEYSTFYDSKITVDEDRWKDICFHSVKQSETAVWFKERHIRLTANKRVHRVKTRTDNFDSLAVQFKNEQYKGAMTKAIALWISNGVFGQNCLKCYDKHKNL